MLYTRSSFLDWLKKVHDCDINPIRNTNVLIIENGPAKSKMWLDGHDRIDYEEIWMHCKNLYIGLPGGKDLIEIGK